MISYAPRRLHEVLAMAAGPLQRLPVVFVADDEDALRESLALGDHVDGALLVAHGRLGVLHDVHATPNEYAATEPTPAPSHDVVDGARPPRDAHSPRPPRRRRARRGYAAFRPREIEVAHRRRSHNVPDGHKSDRAADPESLAAPDRHVR